MFEDFSLCLIVHVRVCNTHSVRSFGMWLKLDSGMRVMLLLLRVLDTQKQRDRKSEMQFFFYQKPILVQLTGLKIVRIYFIEIEGLNPCHSHFIVSSAICKRHTQDQNIVSPGLRRMNKK